MMVVKKWVKVLFPMIDPVARAEEYLARIRL